MKRNLIQKKQIRAVAASIKKELAALRDGTDKQASCWQGMLYCQTGIEWWSYRCMWPADRGALNYKIPEPKMPLNESYQLMPAPGSRMDEHPFWEWYLYSCPQFYVTVESAALALSHHYAAFHRLVVHEADAHALCLDLDEVLHGKRRTDRQKRINQLLLHVL